MYQKLIIMVTNTFKDLDITSSFLRRGIVHKWTDKAVYDDDIIS